MIDVFNISYRVVLVPETGNQLNITKLVESYGWEENEGELAMRINLSIKNQMYNGCYISNIAKPNCIIGIFADSNNISEEVARGKIVEWETTNSGTQDILKLTCYDDLFELQKSQDFIYYSAGAGTKTVLSGIFDDWNIPIEKYEGPNETHAKLVYKSENLSDVILDILDDAEKKGAEKCVIRGQKGRVNIIPRGSNKPIYHFTLDNSVMTKNQLSTSNLITRVKVIGQQDDDENAPVEALVDGKTEYGIRQKIYVRDKDDSIDAAKSSAQEILDEKGDLQRNMTVQAPDIPFIRKGDLVHMEAGNIQGYFFVLGIRHDAGTGKMSLDLEHAE